ncbi:MAG: hypothetical protein HC828_17455 [Blastochloris sp.]|nr:hypothetical protein [Blastochloris sp.]
MEFFGSLERLVYLVFSLSDGIVDILLKFFFRRQSKLIQGGAATFAAIYAVIVPYLQEVLDAVAGL